MLGSINHSEIWEKVNKAFSCDCSGKKVRYKLNRAGTKMFFLQCLRCGDTTRIPKDKVTSPNSLLIQEVDDQLRADWWKKRDQYFSSLRDETQNRERQEWFDWYNRYLLSPEWSKKRIAVMKRANFICEGCLQKTAVQVHHLTYDRVGNEMLFDLVAVCSDCHKAIHEAKRA